MSLSRRPAKACLTGQRGALPLRLHHVYDATYKYRSRAIERGLCMLRMIFALNCLLALLYPVAASAWGYQGHKVVGSIADKLLKPNAKEQVRQILAENDPRRRGELNLQKAAPWPDCVKSVVRHDDKT